MRNTLKTAGISPYELQGDNIIRDNFAPDMIRSVKTDKVAVIVDFTLNQLITYTLCRRGLSCPDKSIEVMVGFDNVIVKHNRISLYS